MKYAWINSRQNEFSVIAMCRFLKVSLSAYYDWLKRPKSSREIENARLTDRLKELFQVGRGDYGSGRLKKRFADLGDTPSRRRIGRLMKRAGLVCKTQRRFKVTTDSKHHHPIVPNLLERQFNDDKPDQCYAGDITYIEARNGWLYLAVVIDLYSRQVVGWSMDQHMTAQTQRCIIDGDLATKTRTRVNLAYGSGQSVCVRQSPCDLETTQDRTKHESQKRLLGYSVESFFGSLKQERVQWRNYQTRYEAQQDVRDYIAMSYNPYRLHAYLGYVSPYDFEKQLLNVEKVA